jgi:hypothetical protein
MRILSFLIFFAVALWLADMMFNNGRYGSKLWLEMNQQAVKLNYEVRRMVKF